jgi:hypothetical protein
MMRPLQISHQGSQARAPRKLQACRWQESRRIQKFAAWLEAEDRKAELLPVWPQNLICTLGLVVLVSFAAFG